MLISMELCLLDMMLNECRYSLEYATGFALWIDHVLMLTGYAFNMVQIGLITFDCVNVNLKSRTTKVKS